MSHRYGVRANIENEQRRLQREPVAIWKKEWVVPSIAAGAQNNVKVLKWIRTPETIRFDPEEEHMVGEETMAVMEVDPTPATVEAIPAIPSTDANSVQGETQITVDSAPEQTTESQIAQADENNANVEQSNLNDESMDITVDQSVPTTEEQVQPAAAANPDTAAIHDSVAIVETAAPEGTSTSTPTQMENGAESVSLPTSQADSQPVSLTTEIESSQPLTQVSLPIVAKTQEGDGSGEQTATSINDITESSIVPPSNE